MDDLISRQAAIDAMEESKVRYFDRRVIIGKMQDIINGLPSAQQWIPVRERLPEKKTEVIYSLENHYVSTGYMTDRDYEGNIVELHWEDLESGVLIYPEAWMPLPEPYKEGKA